MLDRNAIDSGAIQMNCIIIIITHLVKYLTIQYFLIYILNVFRTIETGLLLTRPPQYIGRYKMVRHPKQWRADNGWDIYFHG